MSSYDVRGPGWEQPGAPPEEDRAPGLPRPAHGTEAAPRARGRTPVGAARMDRVGPTAPGLAGAVIAARDAGRLSERDAQAVLFGALAASWETTSTATTLMLLYLAEAGGFVPDLADPPRRAEVIEETLRLGCPFPPDWLICMAPGVIGGTQLQPGTRGQRPGGAGRPRRPLCPRRRPLAP